MTLRNIVLEALQAFHSELRAMGAEMVAITPEPERYTRALHKKLNLTFDILTHIGPSVPLWTDSTTSRITACRSLRDP